ncbi:hypothetical protein [Acidithiobacillus sp.]
MLKESVAFAALLALVSGPALADGAAHWTPPKPGQPICNSAFPGSLKVCHPVGTSPAGVVNLAGGLQFVVLEPFSGWFQSTPLVRRKKHYIPLEGKSSIGQALVKAGPTPALAVFSHGKPVSVDRRIPYFENVQSVQVTPSPDGGHTILIHAYKGGNAPDRYFIMAVHVAPDGKIALSH